jgi:hypothetical protein
MPKAKPKKDQAGTAKLANGGVNKMDAVQQALAALGSDAKPVAIRDWAKDNLKLDLDTDLISTYKGVLKARAAKGGGGKAVGKTKKAVAAKAPAQAARAKSSGAGNDISVQDVEKLKGLVERLGAEQVRQLAGVLGK